MGSRLAFYPTQSCIPGRFIGTRLCFQKINLITIGWLSALNINLPDQISNHGDNLLRFTPPLDSPNSHNFPHILKIWTAVDISYFRVEGHAMICPVVHAN